MQPAANVSVEAKNENTGQIMYATTNSRGEYKFDVVNDNTIWRLHAFDSRGTKFQPRIRVVKLRGVNVVGVYFWGMVRK